MGLLKLKFMIIVMTVILMIVIFSFLNGDVARSISYGVHISQLILFSQVSSHVDGFNTRNKVLTAKVL